MHSQSQNSFNGISPVQMKMKIIALVGQMGMLKKENQNYKNKQIRQQQEILRLNSQIQKLLAQNQHLKRKIQSSKNQVERAKLNFHQSKKMSSSLKKLKFNKEDQDWEEQSEQSQEQNTNTNNTTILNNQKSFLDQTKLRYAPPCPKKTDRKDRIQIGSQNKNTRNLQNSSSKKLQISVLRQQIFELKEENKNSQTRLRPKQQKQKAYDEIKNKYLNKSRSKKQFILNQTYNSIQKSQFNDSFNKQEFRVNKKKQNIQGQNTFVQILKFPLKQNVGATNNYSNQVQHNKIGSSDFRTKRQPTYEDDDFYSLVQQMNNQVK